MAGRCLREAATTLSNVCGPLIALPHHSRPRSVWDLRSFKKPLSTRSGLGTLYPGTNAIFSPDDKYVVSGASATSKGGKGKLMVLNKGDLNEVVRELEVDSTPVKVLWHSKINQVRSLQIHRVTQLKFQWDVDRNRPIERRNPCPLFPSHLPTRRQALAVQRTSTKTHIRRRIRRASYAQYYHTTRVTHVPRRGRYKTREQAEEGKRANGPEEE